MRCLDVGMKLRVSFSLLLTLERNSARKSFKKFVIVVNVIVHSLLEAYPYWMNLTWPLFSIEKAKY